jgi:hypothetical protein
MPNLDPREHVYSASQVDPDWERYLAASERNNPPIGLEDAGILDPYQLMVGFNRLPQGALNALRALGRLGVEGVGRNLGSPLLAAARPVGIVDIRKLYASVPSDQARALQEGAIDAQLSIDDYLKSAHPTIHRRIEMQYPDQMFNSRPAITSVLGKRG